MVVGTAGVEPGATGRTDVVDVEVLANGRPRLADATEHGGLADPSEGHRSRA